MQKYLLHKYILLAYSLTYRRSPHLAAYCSTVVDVNFKVCSINTILHAYMTCPNIYVHSSIQVTKKRFYYHKTHICF